LALASEIPEEDYLKTMENLAEKYLEKLGERGIMANDKTVKYLFQKGFELQLAVTCVKSLSQSEI
jgi:SOS response regulatory protein OraA/RecX